MSAFLEQLALQGSTNTRNDMNVGFSKMLTNVRNQSIREILSDYKNIPHRLEFVATIIGIDFINDAKATNLNATWYALESINKPIIWIVNELDTIANYDKLFPLIRKKVKSIIILQTKTQKATHLFADYVEQIHRVANIDQAVELSYIMGSTGDVVLYSPANSNSAFFDCENNGNLFKKAVRNL